MVALVLGVIIGFVLAVSVATALMAVLRRRTGVGQRTAAGNAAAWMAEARIDLFTRQTVQQMRDTVRDELRDSMRGKRTP